MSLHPPPLVQHVKRVMVIKLRHLGDVVLSTPVFRVLRDHFPAAQLMGCVNAGTEEALLGDPLVDRVVVVRRLDGRRAAWPACARSQATCGRCRAFAPI